METRAVIVSGEAPESDDEAAVISVKTGMMFPSILVSNSCGTMIQGEARESDDENNSVSSASYAIDPSTCSYADLKGQRSEKSCVKYNSLLHKKLRECNKALDRNFKELLSTTITKSVDDLNDTNRQLLKSELVLQETVSKTRISATQFEDTLKSLSRIIDEDYFKNVKL
ncbi:uncharacterized protein LOC116417221 [Nasonia vitripennis]|uniref:Biogenesis of lysosome-related organelles complex 1 subunit 3 n=1 Tax=Nasonia vitripennis TaxID=7425 RepID=A0A7M7QBQ4_NASVI|nr:uncharacterized protein LOC116417221 [Nasonia vitripennis]XP_031785109.1 uncharacterized protein LOC116417221 [Nasonia vitripennis]